MLEVRRNKCWWFYEQDMHHGVLITVNVVWSPRGSSIICRAILWSRAAGHPVPTFHYLSFIPLAAWVSQPVASHADIWMVFCSLWSRTGSRWMLTRFTQLLSHTVVLPEACKQLPFHVSNHLSKLKKRNQYKTYGMHYCTKCTIYGTYSFLRFQNCCGTLTHISANIHPTCTVISHHSNGSSTSYRHL